MGCLRAGSRAASRMPKDANSVLNTRHEYICEARPGPSQSSQHDMRSREDGPVINYVVSVGLGLNIRYIIVLPSTFY